MTSLLIRKNSAGSDSESASSESDTEGEDFLADDGNKNPPKSSRSSKRNGSHSMATAEENYDREENSYEKEADGGHWQAFQSFLLKGADEESHSAKEGMFATENAGKMKRRQSNVVDDPLALGGQDPNEIQDRRMTSIHEVNGNRSRLHRGWNDGFMLSGGRNDGREIGDQMDIHFAETKGRRVIPRTANDDFIVGNREDHSELRSSLDPLPINRFERANSKLDGESSRGTANESFIVPFRSMSLNEGVPEARTVIDMANELSSAKQKSENMSGGIRRQVYEPDDISLIPERGTEKRSIGYDIALDYEMHAGMDKGAKEAAKGTSKKSVNSRNAKGTSDTLDKKRAGGPIRKGKPSKASPGEDARARADKIRAFKADVQKMKKRAGRIAFIDRYLQEHNGKLKRGW